MALSRNQLQALQQLFRQQQQGDDGLLSFRAGHMTMDSNKIVTPKTDRGKIKFSKSDEGLLHLEWINRISNKTILDIMIFPDSAKWVRVEECKDGRVYVLKFNGSSRREFFWMQEPSEEKDKEIEEKVNKLISSDSDGDGANGVGGGAAAQQAQIAQSLGLGNFGGLGGLGALGGLGGFGNLGGAQARSGATGGSGSGGAAASGATGSGAASGGAANNDLTQMFLNALNQQLGGAAGGLGGTGGGAAAGGGGNALMQQMLEQQLQQREELKKEPDLSDILDPSQNEIRQVLDDEKIVERLAEHLPQEMRDRDAILEQLSSPQFLGSLARLNHIINSPQMEVLLRQMGIEPGNKIGVRAFIEAVMKQANPNDNNNNDNNNNNKDKDNNDNNGNSNASSGTSK